MRLDITPYCQLLGAMEVYSSKTTRASEPAPEIRWIIGEDVRIIGFDDFDYQIRLSVARLNGVDCHVSGDDPTEFFTEVPSGRYLDNAVRDTEIVIDTESSQSHLLAYTGGYEYKIEKIPYSDPLEFRQRYLPIDRPIAEGSIQREKLHKCIKLSPHDTLRVKLADGTIKFVSESIDEKVEYALSDADGVCQGAAQSSYSFGVGPLSEAMKNIPKGKQVQFFATEEFIRLRYELGDIGYMNYYQRIKNSDDVYVM